MRRTFCAAALVALACSAPAQGWQRAKLMERRWAPMTAYDPDLGRTVLFGGGMAGTQSVIGMGGGWHTDTWEWDGTAWTEVEGATPPTYYWGVSPVGYDPNTRRILFLHGWEVDEWDGANWVPSQQPSVTGFFDSSNLVSVPGALVTADGYDPYNGYRGNGKVFRLDGSSWSAYEASSSQRLELNPMLIYDGTGRLLHVEHSGAVSELTLVGTPPTVFGSLVQTPVSASPFPGGPMVPELQRDPLTGQPLVIVSGDRTLVFNGNGWTERAVGSTPTGEGGVSWLLDTQRQRVVAHWGETGDTWEWDGAQWALVAKAMTPPAPQNNESPRAAFDEARGEGVMLDSYSYSRPEEARTWIWDGQRWEARASASTPARHSHLTAYDRDRQRVVLLGGVDPATGLPTDETWEWDGNDWALVGHCPFFPTVQGNASSVAAMAYDETHRRTVLYDIFSGTWEWDGVTWTHHASATQPTSSGTMAFHPGRGVVVLFTGSYSWGETWEWDGNDWSLRESGSLNRWPGPMALDRNRGVLMMVVNTSPRGVSTYEWDGNTWSYRPDGDLPILTNTGGLVAFHDPVRRRLVAQGGFHLATFQGSTTWFPSDATFTLGEADTPPVADAGVDLAVDEGAQVMLDGSGSSDPDGDPLSYAWTQLSGTAVTLSDPTAAQPTFDAPLVALGGETLTFQLAVTAKAHTDADTVDVTVVNVNHPPVADAGADQSVAEGVPVTLSGQDSFDVDNDAFTWSWVQVGGPAVAVTGADTANPTFTAPVAGSGGAPGVVATLVFALTVDDGYPMDAPAPGYTFANVTDTVSVDVTNVDNPPAADAGGDQTVDENTTVVLDGTGSSDPDHDALSYAWIQVDGPAVKLNGAATAAPTFMAPFVYPGGADLTFGLTVDDGYGGTASDTVVVHVQNANDPPLVTAAAPTVAVLWPPNHGLVQVGITGVSDPDNNATITIDAVTQDEPTDGTGDGDTAIDAFVNPDGTVLLRAERAGTGNGRVYRIHFTAADPEGSASGVVTVNVPLHKKLSAVDSGQIHDSTQ